MKKAAAAAQLRSDSAELSNAPPFRRRNKKRKKGIGDKEKERKEEELKNDHICHFSERVAAGGCSECI